MNADHHASIGRMNSTSAQPKISDGVVDAHHIVYNQLATIPAVNVAASGSAHPAAAAQTAEPLLLRARMLVAAVAAEVAAAGAAAEAAAILAATLGPDGRLQLPSPPPQPPPLTSGLPTRTAGIGSLTCVPPMPGATAGPAAAVARAGPPPPRPPAGTGAGWWTEGP